MSNQCCGADLKFDGMSASFKRALWIVIAINAVMFVIEMSAGFASSSQALKADALDFLGDTVTYGLSLYVIGMSVVVRARAALFKGASLAVMGLWVMGSTIYYTLHNSAPQAEIMSSIGARFKILSQFKSCIQTNRQKVSQCWQLTKSHATPFGHPGPPNESKPWCARYWIVL